MNVGSLFSGIGGLDLGLERAGMNVKWQVEYDPACARILAEHWPGVKRYGDVRELNGAELEPVDLICGGFPCQPVSVAGSRRIQEDARWLWPEFERLLRVVRPRYALVENVPGLLNVGGMSDVLRGLAGLRYDAEWAVIPAAAMGAPHLRGRVFVVAYANGIGAYERPERRALPEHPRQVFPWRDQAGTKDPRSYLEHNAWWATEPGLGRVADGLSRRLDKERIKQLGNAVVPQVAEWIGRRIMEVEHALPS